MAGKQAVIILGTAIGLGAIVFGVITYIKGKNASNNPTTGDNSTTGGNTATSGNGGNTSYTPSRSSNSGFPIGPGSTNTQAVKDIQNYVNSVNTTGIYGAQLVVDGKFGPLTAAGVQAVGYTVPVSQSDYEQMTATYTAPATDNSTSNTGSFPSGDVPAYSGPMFIGFNGTLIHNA